MSRILNWSRSVYEQVGEIEVPSEVKKDFKWQHTFLPLYNGVPNRGVVQSGFQIGIECMV